MSNSTVCKDCIHEHVCGYYSTKTHVNPLNGGGCCPFFLKGAHPSGMENFVRVYGP